MSYDKKTIKQLKTFIQKAQQRGQTDDQILQSLVSHGWKKDDVIIHLPTKAKSVVASEKSSRKHRARNQSILWFSLFSLTVAILGVLIVLLVSVQNVYRTLGQLSLESSSHAVRPTLRLVITQQQQTPNVIHSRSQAAPVPVFQFKVKANGGPIRFQSLRLLVVNGRIDTEADYSIWYDSSNDGIADRKLARSTVQIDELLGRLELLMPNNLELEPGQPELLFELRVDPSSTTQAGITIVLPNDDIDAVLATNADTGARLQGIKMFDWEGFEITSGCSDACATHLVGSRFSQHSFVD